MAKSPAERVCLVHQEMFLSKPRLWSHWQRHCSAEEVWHNWPLLIKATELITNWSWILQCRKFLNFSYLLLSSLSPPSLFSSPFFLHQVTLNIYPLALRPGATPPIKSPEEKSVSFDEPVQVKTLYNPTKVRIQYVASHHMWLVCNCQGMMRNGSPMYVMWVSCDH